MNRKVSAILYLVAGLLFVVAALVGKNYVFIPIGICHVILGIVHGREKK